MDNGHFTGSRQRHGDLSRQSRAASPRKRTAGLALYQVHPISKEETDETRTRRWALPSGFDT
jgi:hypothetical protein